MEQYGASKPLILCIAGRAGYGRGEEYRTGVALRLAADGLDVAVNDVEANSDDLDSVAEEIRQEGRRTVFITPTYPSRKRSEPWWGASPTSLGSSTSWWRTQGQPM
jgi:hypothetical protein